MKTENEYRYVVDPGVIKLSSDDLITPDWEAPPYPPSAWVTQTTSNGFLYCKKGWDKERSVSNLLDQHQRLDYWWCDVVWCRWLYCWFSQFGNQKPKTLDPPASSLNHNLSNFPLILIDPMCARHTHEPPPRLSPPFELLTPWENRLLALQTIVTAHHTSISNLTRNLMFGAKRAQPQMIPGVTSSAELNSDTVSMLPYNQAAVTVLKTWGWKSNNCTLWSDVIWVSVHEANSNWHAMCKF